MDRKWMRNYKADVKREDLQMFFQRLYRDGRDIMSDCLKPQWEPMDDFVITVVATKSWEEITQHDDIDIIVTCRHVEELARTEIRTKDKRVANWLWYLGAKTVTTYEQILAMQHSNKF